MLSKEICQYHCNTRRIAYLWDYGDVKGMTPEEYFEEDWNSGNFACPKDEQQECPFEFEHLMDTQKEKNDR